MENQKNKKKGVLISIICIAVLIIIAAIIIISLAGKDTKNPNDGNIDSTQNDLNDDAPNENNADNTTPTDDIQTPEEDSDLNQDEPGEDAGDDKDTEGEPEGEKPEDDTSDNESNLEETPDNPTDTPDNPTDTPDNPTETNPEEKEETVADVDNLTYTREDNTVYFGAYPQTLVSDETVIATLNAKIKTFPNEGDEGSDGWISYGYFALDDETRNMVESNYMWYKDVVSGGIRYRGVYFTSYRANKVSDSNRSQDNSFQDNNGYTVSTVYWFKHEPISWTVVDESEGVLTLVCNLAIDAQHYDYSTEDKSDYRARYDQSTIRAWLNATFYETAFNDLQKAMIEKTLVDNSIATQGTSFVPAGTGENTEDNVFLLSAEEVKTYFEVENTRKKNSTDYAKAQGLEIDSSNVTWWLRSGANSYYDYAQNIGFTGKINHNAKCYITYTNAIVPALKINIA